MFSSVLAILACPAISRQARMSLGHEAPGGIIILWFRENVAGLKMLPVWFQAKHSPLNFQARQYFYGILRAAISPSASYSNSLNIVKSARIHIMRTAWSGKTKDHPSQHFISRQPDASGSSQTGLWLPPSSLLCTDPAPWVSISLWLIGDKISFSMNLHSPFIHLHKAVCASGCYCSNDFPEFIS